MFQILPHITSLVQYVKLFNTRPVLLRITHCPSCGLAHPWLHGRYFRQADRINPSCTSLNPVPIQRFFCPGCSKTCSVLPECIPSRRWYLWDIQQLAVVLWLTGTSLCAIEKALAPSRQTVRRWVGRFTERFRWHADALRGYWAALGRASGLKDFWRMAFTCLSLAEAMRLCWVAGVFIP